METNESETSHGKENKEGSMSYSTLPTEELNRSYGYDMYPERRSNRPWSLTGWLFSGKDREKGSIRSCERKVYNMMKDSPILRNLLGAFRTAGCDINVRRHISCEYCGNWVHGGYDPITNQIVICYNNTTRAQIIKSVLIHEFIHMYDYCTHKLDFNNIDHLACTEIRAANLTYCSYLSAMLGGHYDSFGLKKKHGECVKIRAAYSVYGVRDITLQEARAAVDRVFEKCYADMEPLGRRIRSKKQDPYLIYSEGFMFGYD